MVSNIVEPMRVLKLKDVIQCNDEAIEHEHGMFQSKKQEEQLFNSPQNQIKAKLTSAVCADSAGA